MSDVQTIGSLPTLSPEEFNPMEIAAARAVYDTLKATAANRDYLAYKWQGVHDYAVEANLTKYPATFASQIGRLIRRGASQEDATALVRQQMQDEKAVVAARTLRHQEEERLVEKLQQTQVEVEAERRRNEKTLERESRQAQAKAEAEIERIRSQEARERRQRPFPQQWTDWRRQELDQNRGLPEANLNLLALVDAAMTAENPIAVQKLCNLLGTVHHFPAPKGEQIFNYHYTFLYVAKLLGNSDAQNWQELATWHAEKMRQKANECDV